ncbi:MAG: hypothetical protein ACJAZN_000672 [Planctomycetota bacterium]|jgi:uncharacterized protein (UPF0548 family)
MGSNIAMRADGSLRGEDPDAGNAWVKGLAFGTLYGHPKTGSERFGAPWDHGISPVTFEALTHET